jgi:RNA polymerase sigma-70 factor (ECF subfamily)
VIEELRLPLPRSFASEPAAEAGAERVSNPAVDLAALVEAYASTVFRVAHAVLRNTAEAEDVVQDTFVRVLQHQQRAQRHSLPPIRELRPWLIRIAWNLALDRCRRTKPDQADELFLGSLVSATTPADVALEDARQVDRVLAAIDRLPTPERQALLLSALEELDTAEIARIMAKSESAVRALLFRARTQLRTRLASAARTQGGAR